MWQRCAWSALLGLSVVCAVLVGVEPTVAAPEAEAKTKAGVAPADNDTLLRYYASDPDYVNPLLANDTVSEEFMRFVYETMAEPKMSNPDELEPKLAEKWEFDEKNLEFTIHLRKGIKWQSIKTPKGKVLEPRDFTARDVKFTFDCILNPNTQIPALRTSFEDPDATEAGKRFMIKVSVVDASTIKVKWTKPYFLMFEATLNIPIIPRHVFSIDEGGKPISLDFQSKEFAEGFNEHWANRQMCGTGPLLFREWTKGKQVVLERNPAYWGTPYYFSRAVYEYTQNPETVRQQVLQNELDWASIPEKDTYLQSKMHPNVKDKKVIPIEYVYPGYRYVGYNLKREFFKDKRVRLALAHAVRVDELIQSVFKGLATRTTGISLKGSPNYDSSLPEIPYDLDKARSLLSAAGWEDSDGDGIRDKIIGGKKIVARYDLMIYNSSPSFTTIAEVIKEDSRKIGVDVKVSPAEWNLMLQKLKKKDFDAAMLGWALSWKPDPLQIWHSSQADVPDSSNSISYRNPEVDKLIEELRMTVDVKKQQAIYHKLHRILYDDQPYTFLFSELRTGFYDARLENIKSYALRPCVDDSEWSAKRPRTSLSKASAQ